MRIRARVALALLLLLACAVLLPTAALAVGTGSISGACTGASNGEPEAGDAYLEQWDGDAWHDIQTSHYGPNYLFSGLEAGTYRVRAETYGWPVHWYPSATHAENATPIVLSDGEQRVADIPMYGPTRINVYPVSRNSGWALPSDNVVSLWMKLGGTWQQVATGGQSPGYPYVIFYGPYDGTVRIVVTPTTGLYRTLGYPDGTDLATAGDVTVPQGGEVDIVARLRPEPCVMTGVVRSSDGSTVANASVECYIRDLTPFSGKTALVQTVTADSQGRYRVDGLETGSYFMQAADPSGLWAPALWRWWLDDTTAITTDTPGVRDVTMHRAIIRGRVVDGETGAPVAGVNVHISGVLEDVMKSTDVSGAYFFGPLQPSLRWMSLHDPLGRFPDMLPSPAQYNMDLDTIIDEQFTTSIYTTLTASSSKTVTAYRETIKLNARPRRLVTKQAVNKVSVTFQRLVSGSWRNVGSAVASAGVASISIQPTSTVTYRAVFPASGPFLASESRPFTIQAHALVSRPSGLAKVRVRRAYRVSGALYPKHPAGYGPVRLTYYRKTSYGWQFVKQVTVKTTNTTTASVYSSTFTPTKRGSWAVSAVHPQDAGHLTSESARRYFTVY